MTVLIPLFNEVENLDRIKSTFSEYFAQSKTHSKVLFIDDGSKDGSYEKVKEICTGNPLFTFIKFKENRGLSAAIKAGFDACDTELVGYIDADLQTTPFDFDVLLKDIDNYDAVIGFRAKRKDTFNKRVQSKIANGFRRRMINDGIRDTGCPLKVIDTDVAKRIPFFHGMHRFMAALIQLQGGTIKQIEVQHFERIAGKSKFTIFNRSLGPLVDTFAYRWMRKRYINYEIEHSDLNSED